MTGELNLDIEKLKNSFETVKSVEAHIFTHNCHEYFFEMEDYIDSVNLKHNKCFSGYQERIYEITESIDKIKNKINFLADSLSKTITMYEEIDSEVPRQEFDVERTNSDVELRQNLQTTNNDSSQVIIPVPKPVIEEKQEGLFPEGYDTTPIGLGIAAAGLTGAAGAIVIDSMMPKSAKSNKPKYEVDDDDINDYHDYQIADEAEEKPVISLKIDPSMTSYQASRNKEEMKKFYADEDEQ